MDSYFLRIGKRVRELRVKAKLSQEKLADLTNFHFSYIGQIERGEKEPSLKSLLKIARVLGVNLSVLLDDDIPEGLEAVTQQFLAIATQYPLEDVKFELEQMKRNLEYNKRKK